MKFSWWWLSVVVGCDGAGLVRLDIPEDVDLAARPGGDDDVVPEAFSWRKVPGRSYGEFLGPSQNQHIPQYCGGCFLFAAFHTLMDRVKISRQFLDVDAYPAPDLVPAHQVFLNCGKHYGSCVEGGSAPHVWRWVRDFDGVPTTTCQPYLARPEATCSPANVCRNCMPSPGTAWAEKQEHSCWAVDDVGHGCEGDNFCATNAFPTIAVDDFGVVAPLSDRAMRREIAKFGPIACNVDASVLTKYRSGIAVDLPKGRTANDTDHVIELVGYGEEDGVKFWEFRNSWGEYWGDLGFGKIRRGQNDLLVESACFWVEPAGWGVPNSNQWQQYFPPPQKKDTGDLVFRGTTTTGGGFFSSLGFFFAKHVHLVAGVGLVVVGLVGLVGLARTSAT